MGPDHGRNEEFISYFPIEEYVNKIKLKKYVLQHMEETNRQFDSYMQRLKQVENYSMIFYWLDSLVKELKFSQRIENKYDYESLNDDEMFFDTLTINHQRIKNLHKFVTKREEIPSEYRTTEVNVSRFINGKEDIFWRGVNSEDVKPFMDDFIKFYKQTNLSVLSNNPFLKSALTHLIFLRIHPFVDGNGRTARLIHNIKFTDAVNRLYQTNLKICPLNLSQNIYINKPTYAKRIDNIYFDLEHDCNDEINMWFNFILDMADEQLYFSNKRLPKLEKSFENIRKMQDDDDSIIAEHAKKLKLF